MKNKTRSDAAASLRTLAARRCAAECLRLRGEIDSAEALKSSLSAEELALSSLHPELRELLCEVFVERKRGYIERLCERLCCTPSTVYRRCRAALDEYAARLYGGLHK